MTTTPEQLERALDRAATLGNRAGEDAAYWAIQDLWGGRATRGETEAAAEFLRRFDDGHDTGLCEPQLSGEYSDEPTPQSLAIDCGIDEDDGDAIDELCTAWEEACSEAYWGTLERSAREQVGPAAAYDWEWSGPGGILTRLADGWNVWLQGDDASQFDDEWEACEDDEQQNVLGGQYFPTEYRRAACSVLTQALWDYHREDVQGHPRPGDKLREKFARMFPRRIARRYFD